MDAARREKVDRLRKLISQIEETTSGPAQQQVAGCRDEVSRISCTLEMHGEDEKAYRRAVDLCSYHDFSSRGMKSRLKREGFSPEACELAVKHAVDVSLIDDARWGEMRAAALMRKGMGIPGIERELRENGIDPHAVHGWPDDYTLRYGSEFNRALHVVEIRPPRSKNPQASAYARLLRKGYSQAIAMKASRAWAESR
jgi:regulatory protein